MTDRPSLRRRRLVSALVKLRKAAQVEPTELAERLDWSTAKISRIENFKNHISAADCRAWCVALEVPREVTDGLVALARESKRRGWWHVYPDTALGEFVDYLEILSDAVALREFEADVIPGMLQIESYMRAVFRAAERDASQETIDSRTKMRLAYQEQARDRGLGVSVILDEAVLRRPIGGRVAMAEQLDWLCEAAEAPGVRIQILPTVSGAHPAMGTPFTLLDLPDGDVYVYVETLNGGTYLEGDDGGASYVSAWADLQAMALDFDRSVSLIRTISDEHRSDT